MDQFFDYKVVTSSQLHWNDRVALEKQLNSFGSEGWELVIVKSDGTYIFKRRYTK